MLNKLDVMGFLFCGYSGVFVYFSRPIIQGMIRISYCVVHVPDINPGEHPNYFLNVTVNSLVICLNWE